jgi:hypothetical protein
MPGSSPQAPSAANSPPSPLYEFLTDQNAVPTDPVKGVKRPKVDSYEGKTPAIADHPNLRSTEDEAGGLANLQSQLLTPCALPNITLRTQTRMTAPPAR